MEKFQNKYRNESARARGWNYGSHKAYYITICSGGREKCFGRIVKSEYGKHMQLSPIGQIVAEEWIRTPFLRPQMNITLDEFIIMPDHFHAIIIIGENESNSVVSTYLPYEYAMDAKLRQPGPINHNTQNKFGPQSWNLSSIIRGFKSAVTTRVRILGNENFKWQPRFHDRIINNADEFQTKQKYIVKNPMNYPDDH
jgi:putative transposase